jgi:hypothetical protein
MAAKSQPHPKAFVLPANESGATTKPTDKSLIKKKWGPSLDVKTLTTGQSMILQDGEDILFTWSSAEVPPDVGFNPMTAFQPPTKQTQITSISFTSKRVIMKYMQHQSSSAGLKREELSENQLAYAIEDLLYVSAAENGPGAFTCCCPARVSLTVGFSSYSNMAQFTIFDKGDSGVSNVKQALEIISSKYQGSSKKAPFAPGTKV